MRNQRYGNNYTLRSTSWLLGITVLFLGADSVSASDRERPLHQTAQITGPLLFERNVGQAGTNTEYLVHAGPSTLYFDKGSVSILNAGDTTAALRMTFGDPLHNAVSIDGLQRENVPVNYLVGSDPGK